VAPNVKRGLIILIGGAGFIGFLIGALTSAYSVVVGLIIGIGFWILTGAVSTMIGVKN
jgi:hypothetical protein